MLLRNSKIQNAIASEAAKQIAVKFNTKVSIGDVHYEFFNKFSFDNLIIEDLQKDTLLFVDKAYSDFDFWHLFKGKFLFNKVELHRLNANLKTDEKGISNLDFIIKLFKKPKKSNASPIEFNFKEIKIIDSRFSFINRKHLFKQDSTLFNLNNLHFSHINADITVDYLKGDSLAARIKALSLSEKSGFNFKSLQTSIYGWKKGFWIPKLDISLAHSNLSLDSVQLSYDSIANLNDIANKVKWSAKINPSTIVLSDFSSLSHNLKNINQPAVIQGKLKGFISNFSLKGLELKYGKSLMLKTDVDLNGISNIDEAFLYADVKTLQLNKSEVQDLIARIMNRPFVLPEELSRLGTVKYNGNISGFFSNLVTYGNISTRVGNLKTDILLQFENKMHDLKYSGKIRTNNFQLGTLLASKEIGQASFSISTNGSKLYQKPFQGTVKGNIAEIYLNHYNYQQITLDGSYDGNGFDGSVNINDPNLQADFNGVVDLKDKNLPVFNFDLTVENADVNALKLTDKYKGSKLSFTGNTNMIGNSLDNLNGFLALNDIRFVNGDKLLEFNQFMFESEVGKNNSKFTISSDLVNGIFEGDFKYSTLPQTIRALVENYIPALSGKGSPNRKVSGGNNFMNIDLTLSDTKKISDVLELPFAIDGNTTVKGYIDDLNQRVELTAKTPFISFGKKKLQDIDISLNNPDHKLNLNGKASIYFKEDLVHFNLKAAAENDSLYTQLAWQNSDSVNYAGEIQTVTKFKKTEDLTTAQINILPTQVIISDTTWNLNASKININPDTTFTINNFKFQHGNQYIVLNGLVSKKESDTLHVKMNELQIAYILDLLNIKAISVEGITTGDANLYSVLKKPVFEADLNVQDAKLNNALIGNASLHSVWDKEKEEIAASGKFFNSKGDLLALANGVYIPKKDSIDFVFDANKLNLGFLQRYLSSILSDISGIGTGKVRMFGRTKSIGFEGKVFAENTRATVDYLKTAYSFSDTIYLTRKSISFADVTIYDDDKNTGTLTGNITHNGAFKDMKFDAKVNTRNIMALNTKSQDNDFFYGKAYAAGNVHIYGSETDVYFDINVTSRPNTKFYLSIGSAETANSNDFITFVKHSENKDTIPKISAAKKSANIHLDMEIDVNPNADIQLVIDPKGRDNITAKGNGNLRLTYDPNNDLRLYGGYTIEKGSYLFTLQDFIRKEFKIDQGSSVNWSGDPFRAKLNIRAIYSLTASLKDLNDQTLLSSTSRSSIPVNVILNISDDLTNPSIKFDIDLPSSDETLKYQIKNLMNTEEMMNRQVAYLLLLGKFYTPDYAKTADAYNSNLLSGTLSPLLNTTLFGQVNSILSQVVGNLSVGVNIRDTGTSAVKSQEYEGAVFYQPNNRLILNGNFGYRNDNLAKNKFIGDVDIEYLLTSNGKFRLKVYNHTVDRYTLSAGSAQFRQAVGLMYKETFNSWDELIKHYWRIFNTNKKNENQTNKKDSVK